MWFCTNAKLLSDKISSSAAIGRVRTLPSGQASEANRINCFVGGGKASNSVRAGGGGVALFAACLSRRLEWFRMASSAPVGVPVAASVLMMLRAVTSRPGISDGGNCVHASTLRQRAVLFVTSKRGRLLVCKADVDCGAEQPVRHVRGHFGQLDARSSSSSAAARFRILLTVFQHSATASDL